jgi:hypothetical protein
VSESNVDVPRAFVVLGAALAAFFHVVEKWWYVPEYQYRSYRGLLGRRKRLGSHPESGSTLPTGREFSKQHRTVLGPRCRTDNISPVVVHESRDRGTYHTHSKSDGEVERVECSLVNDDQVVPTGAQLIPLVISKTSKPTSPWSAC